MLRRQSFEYAVVLGIPENIFYQEVLKGVNKAQEELREFRVKVQIQFVDTIDGPKQAKLIHRLVAEGVNGIVLMPVDSDDVRIAIEAGARKGVKFVTLVSDINESKRLCFVGQDHYRSGRVAGGLMDLLLQREQKIACFIGSNQLLAHRARLEGFRDRFLENRDQGDIVEVLENHDSSSFSESLTRSLLERHPELGGIFVAGAGVPGIGEGLAAKAQSGRIRMVSYDLVQSGSLCRDGVIDFVIDQDPFQEGYEALSVLNRSMMFGEVPQEHIFTRIDIRTRDSVDLHDGGEEWRS